MAADVRTTWPSRDPVSRKAAIDGSSPTGRPVALRSVCLRLPPVLVFGAVLSNHENDNNNSEAGNAQIPI